MSMKTIECTVCSQTTEKSKKIAKREGWVDGEFGLVCPSCFLNESKDSAMFEGDFIEFINKSLQDSEKSE